jgi:DNA-binding NtrC family response regulator
MQTKLLIVDDDTLLRRSLKHWLARQRRELRGAVHKYVTEGPEG